MTVLGVDVSFYQDVNSTPQQIDFVKMREQGAKFVYIRVAFGTVPDEDFAYNWREAKKAGLLRGGYCFWNYWEGAPEASTQIAFWKSMLQADPGEMPPALDMEKANANYPDLPASSVCFDTLWQFHKMCEELRRRTKLYTNVATLWERLTPAPAWATTEVDLWLAQWYVQQKDLDPAPWPKVTTWQQGLGKNQGYDFGAESKDIDIDYFLGTEAELYKYANVSAPPSDPKPPEEKPPMGTYDTYAKGVLLQHTTPTPDKSALAGANFMVIETGWGTDYYPEAAERVGLAYELGIPAILHYKMDAGPYQSMGYDVDKWPKPDLDLHVKTLDRAIFMGGVPGGAKRAVSAILFDLTYNQDLTSKVYFTETWMAGLADHLTELFWKRYSIPIYWLCTQKVLNDYGNKSNGHLATLFTNQPMSCIKMAFSHEPETVSISTCAELLPPPQVKDPESGQMVDQKPDYLYGNPWLWQYTRSKFSLNGIQVPALLFWGKKEKLYAELNFKAITPSDPTKPPTGDDEIPTDPSGVIAAINEVNNRIRELTEIVKAGFRLP